MSERRESFRLIGKASLIMMALTLLDKVFALAKEIVVADRFGISPSLDVFNIAYALPALIIALCTTSVVAALVPVYIKWSHDLSDEDADARALSMFYLAALVFAAVAAAGFVLSPWYFQLIGYTFSPEQRALGIGLERVLIFLIFVEGSSTILTAVILARKKFVSLQIAPLFVNAGMIGWLLLYQKQYGISALVWGCLIGTLLKGLYMALVLRRGGFRFIGKVQLERAELGAFVSLALPLLGSEFLSNSNIFVDQIMATKLVAGSVSALRYATRINDLYIHIIIMAFSRAIFPFITEKAIQKDDEGMRFLFTRSVTLLGLVTFPAICVIAIFSQNIVSILLQRGAFDPHATKVTGEILFYYSLGLFFYAYTFVNHSFFTALRDIKPLIQMGCLSIVLNVVFNLIFMHFLGVKGIALSTSVRQVILFFVFFQMLKQKLGLESFSSVLDDFRSIVIASVTALVCGLISVHLMDSAGFNSLLSFLFTCALMAFCYGLVLWEVRTAEIEEILRDAGKILKSSN